MAGSIQKAVVLCPNCGNTYMDWCQPSIGPEGLDEEFLDLCKSALCPLCRTKVYFEMMVLEDGVYRVPEKK
jgi:hypothetical protein